MITLPLFLLIALTGPANCRFSVPSDIAAGTAEWIGPCEHNLAQGVGVLRVAQANGRAELFYGQLDKGLPVQGFFGNSEGEMNNPVHAFSPRTGHSADDNGTTHPSGQDARLWSLAAAAARVAQKHYAALGNKASAAFYAARAKELARGPAE